MEVINKGEPGGVVPSLTATREALSSSLPSVDARRSTYSGGEYGSEVGDSNRRQSAISGE